MRLRKGQYTARLADGADDVNAVLALRSLAFRQGQSCDSDTFDGECRHVLVEDNAGHLVCCFRLLPLADGADIGRSYAAQFYELSGLGDFGGPMVEMGRFCIRPGLSDPDILRIAWGAMTQFVDESGVELLFGCSSFQGTEATSYLDTFAWLSERHLAPPRLRPRVKAPSVFRFAKRLRDRVPDPKRAFKAMPPLLRSYLAMGGWVSDHAVVDRDLNTLHVFTALEIREIPPARARLMRAVAS